MTKKNKEIKNAVRLLQKMHYVVSNELTTFPNSLRGKGNALFFDKTYVKGKNKRKIRAAVVLLNKIGFIVSDEKYSYPSPANRFGRRLMHYVISMKGEMLNYQ